MSKIMIVDDDADIRYLIRMMLEMEGYDVAEAGSGEECLVNLNATLPDLVLLDINMTGIDGWEVCRQLKEKNLARSVPVSMLSARHSKEDIKRSMEYAHADAHLIKPVDKRELLDTVKLLLDKAV